MVFSHGCYSFLVELIWNTIQFGKLVTLTGGGMAASLKRPNSKKKMLLACAVWLLLVTVTMTFHPVSPASAAERPQSTGEIDAQRLAGRWLRLDGGYILELKEIGTDGTLKAFYFNLRPINVAEAKYSRREGTLTIFVELRDVNYPGSKYNLHYDPKTDRLSGTYFQAVQGETYKVEFMRMK